MKKITLINETLYMATFMVQSFDYVFCVVVESNPKATYPHWKKGLLEELICEAYKLIPQDTHQPELPHKMAEAIHRVLLDWKEKNDEPFITPYSSFVWFDGTIYACVLGGSRIHLVQNQTILGVTVDHSVFYENEVGNANDLDLNNALSVQIAKEVMSRCLGSGIGENEYAFYKWKAEGEFCILMCSREFHKFRNPDEYIYELVEQDVKQVESPFKGFILKVEF